MAEAAPCFKDIWVRGRHDIIVTLDGSMEVMLVEITNKTDEAMEIVPIGAIPIYGRSADNIRDHRHVTSLLHRIETTQYGIEVTPVLSFDERGHRKMI